MPQRLFEPITLPHSGLALENRLVMAPMPTFAALPDGRISPAEVAYLQRRARGGLAAIVTAGCSVSPDGQCVAGQWRCDHDGLIDSLAQAARAIQSGSASGGRPVRAVLQLCHGGSIALGDRALGPTQMTARDAPALCRAFGDAARRGGQAGFDAVEIHGGHGYLPQQFFSRRTNRRRWAWGGESVLERARLPLALAEAVGSACGKDFSCWYRLTPEEPGPDGIEIEDTLRLAEALAGSGVEVIDVAARAFAAGSIRAPQDPVPPAVRVQQAVGGRACVMAAGRLKLPEQALQVIASGIPLVGLGRILLSEPDWARKVAEQSPEPLRAALPRNATLNDLALPSPCWTICAANRTLNGARIETREERSVRPRPASRRLLGAGLDLAGRQGPARVRPQDAHLHRPASQTLRRSRNPERVGRGAASQAGLDRRGGKRLQR